MWENRLRKLLQSNSPTLSTRFHSVWPTIAELVGYTGWYDYAEFTAEYAPFNVLDLENLSRALTLHKMTGMIKVGQESREFQTVKALNSGFQAINFADVRNPADALACVRAVRAETPELQGLRGVGQGRDAKHVIDSGSKKWVDSSAEAVICFMIEKKEAVETIDGILDTDGLDMVVFGRSDYSVSIGRPGERDHPEVREAHEYVMRETLKRGIHMRGEINDPKDAEYYLNFGVRHFSLGIDIRILHNWWKEQGEQMRGILGDL